MAFVIAETCIGTKDTAYNTCTHRGGPLSEGELEGDEVTCPWHGAKFKVSSGEVLSPPAPQGVGSYKVRVNGPDIELEL